LVGWLADSGGWWLVEVDRKVGREVGRKMGRKLGREIGRKVGQKIRRIGWKVAGR
jgi:hypothetical protein